MALTVFFSWQSDTPAGVGLDFIERALEQALARVAEDAKVEKAIRDEGLKVDRDTKGVPGMPPIVDTIFKKIDRAVLFVPDLTFVGTRRNGRPTPNPNVLVEYGYALKSLGHSRIVPVMNAAYGEPTSEAVPFDMRHLRWPLTFDLPDGAAGDQKHQEGEKLAKDLETAIHTFLKSDDVRAALPKPPGPPPFPAAEAKDGSARFRTKGAALAISHGRWPLDVAKEVRLRDGPALWLRVMPVADPQRKWLATDLKKSATKDGFFLMPLGGQAYSDLSYMMAEDGFGTYGVPRGGPNPTVLDSVVFVFETGEVWGIDTHMLGASDGIPYVERDCVDALDHYAAFLRDRLGIRPPYRWIAGMEGVKGRPLFGPVRKGTYQIQNPRGACVAEVIVEEGVHEEATAAKVSLRPFFKKVYARCAVDRPAWMDDGS